MERDSEYKFFKNSFCEKLNINNDFLSEEEQYSTLEDLPNLLKKASEVVGSIKRETSIREASLLDKFDSKSWTNKFSNQIYQINNCGTGDYFFPVLRKEADDLLQELFNTLSS